MINCWVNGIIKRIWLQFFRENWKGFQGISGKESNLNIFGRQAQTRHVHSFVHLFCQQILIKPLPRIWHWSRCQRCTEESPYLSESHDLVREKHVNKFIANHIRICTALWENRILCSEKVTESLKEVSLKLEGWAERIHHCRLRHFMLGTCTYKNT